MKLSLAHLPPSVAKLIGMVGMTAALKIVEARGGVRFYVPVEATPEHWLAELLGMEAFACLVAQAAGDEIEVPRCLAAMRAARHLVIAAEKSAGSSRVELALRHGYTERGIRKVLKRVEADGAVDQLRLFSDPEDGEAVA